MFWFFHKFQNKSEYEMFEPNVVLTQSIWVHLKCYNPFHIHLWGNSWFYREQFARSPLFLLLIHNFDPSLCHIKSWCHWVRYRHQMFRTIRWYEDRSQLSVRVSHPKKYNWTNEDVQNSLRLKFWRAVTVIQFKSEMNPFSCQSSRQSSTLWWWSIIAVLDTFLHS